MPKREEYYQDDGAQPAGRQTLDLLGDDLLEVDPATGRGRTGASGPGALNGGACPLDRAAPARSGGPRAHPADDLPGLFARGKQQGFVTAEEILQIQPEPEMHLEEVDELYAELLDLNIEVLDEQEVRRPGTLSSRPTGPSGHH